MTPDPTHADRVDELGRVRDLVEALPAVGGYVDVGEVMAVLRERTDLLCWGEQSGRIGE